MTRILLIEDDDLLRAGLRRVLGGAGYDLVEASNGTTGVQAYKNRPSDLVITDIVMPDMDGLETIRELRRLQADVKIIAISGGGLGDATTYLNIARRFGAIRTLTKPFTAAEILTVVAEVLRPIG